MLRWLAYLVVYAVAQVITWVITPLLPLFAVTREGPVNNNEKVALGPRLPEWLAWFNTPDNSLEGDAGFIERNGTGYWQSVVWLYRNSLYGFKWSVLAAPVIVEDLYWFGDTTINRTTNEGYLYVQMGEHWQLKVVKRIPGTSRCVMFNFGWLLDAYVSDPLLVKTQPKALWMCSPRFPRYEGK